MEEKRAGMTRTVFKWLTLIIVLAVGWPASPLFAQTPYGEIEGSLTDESGAALPGATVTVESPALIEKTRETVSDGDGKYRFLRLPVGSYRVHVAMVGFNAVQRDDVMLNSGFTATLNFELKLGSLQETLTVVGDSPVIDVRSTTTQTVLTHDAIEAIPSARNVFDMTKFIIGASTATPDVGGSTSHLYTSIQIHGSRGNDRGYYRDGVRIAAYFGDGDAPRAYGATGAQQEVNYETSAIPASVAHGGVVINMVSRDGGNRPSGTLIVNGTNDNFQSSNLTQELRDRGVVSTSGAKKAYDVDSSFGGPLKQGKMWAFGSARLLSFTSLLANQVDLSGAQAVDFIRRFEYFGKTTNQINASNKLMVSMNYDGSYRPNRRESATFVTEEASGFNTSGRNPYNRTILGNWVSTLSNSWLLEVGWGHSRVGASTVLQQGVDPNGFSRLDLVTNTLTGAAIRLRADQTSRDDYNVAMTKVGSWKGSHQIKFGSQGDFGKFPEQQYTLNDTILNYRNGVPDSIDQVNTPVLSETAIREFGFYAQDSWQLASRLTINAGVRYDYFNVFIPGQQAPAGRWVPERTFAEIPVVTWNNVVPRLGVAYDLLGNGRTVLKGSFSKYMGVEAAGVAQSVNPMFRSTNRCAWRDLNSDNAPQADEISQCQGFSGGVSTTYDPDLRRPFNREVSLGVQHEVARDLAMSVMYFRRENRDLRGTFNRAVPTASYVPVTITNPIDSAPLTIYNQSTATAGRQDNLLANSDKLDNDYNGIEIALQRRFSRSGSFMAGYHYGKNLGRIVTTGDLNDPNNDIFADGAVRNDEPHQFKLSGNYLLPGQITASGFYSARSGQPRQRQLVVSRTMVPALTRASQTVRIEPNNVLRYEPVALLDLRFGRVFRFKGSRFEPFVDLYNLTNNNTILGDVTTIGSSLGVVSSTVNPRIVKFGAKFEF